MQSRKVQNTSIVSLKITTPKIFEIHFLKKEPYIRLVAIRRFSGLLEKALTNQGILKTLYEVLKIEERILLRG